MVLTELHARLLAQAFEALSDTFPQDGDMAYVRCLSPDVVAALAAQGATFAPRNWRVRRVADQVDGSLRTIAADQAVELREAKGRAVLLLVDTTLAGAGMDGIYSAAREIDEAMLFDQALSLAQDEINRVLPRGTWPQAQKAIKKARGYGQRFSVSRWTEFDFLVRLAAEKKQPGALLYLLGLWPVQQGDEVELGSALNVSRLFVERLLGTAVAGMTPSQRLQSLRLFEPSPAQLVDLERFLQAAATQPLLPALANLADKEDLWVNALSIEGKTEVIHSIELTKWRNNNGRIAKWSGLVAGPDEDDPPVLILSPDAGANGNDAKLVVRWKSRPDNLAKSAVDYHVVIVTDMDEEVATRDVHHAATREEKCQFTDDDFSLLSDDALLSAKLVLTVVGNDKVEKQESEEFTIRFGTPPDHEPAGVGKKVRTFSEGLIELPDRAIVADIAATTDPLPEDAKGFVLLRPPQRGKSFRVFRPPLIRDVEKDWIARQGAVGRWRVRVRASGVLATVVEFVPLAEPDPGPDAAQQTPWERVTTASRRMAERFAVGGGVGQIYDEKAKGFDTVVKEYLLAWALLLEQGDPANALANTVEVQTLSGKTIGLIVLPSHPLRVAWHVAYDNLVLHAAFEQGGKPTDIRKEFAMLDGAMFPAFLPGLANGAPFVFADTLGFHAVGMVPDHDKEPKAAVAILARALGESDTADTVPTIGEHSAQVLGHEILKYIACHREASLLHVHALRPGDGLTVARALGHVQKEYERAGLEADPDDSPQQTSPAFVLELYPSPEQRGVAGRFIAEIREKRRSGAGVVPADDRWMLESLSLPGGINRPKLRWARKRDETPQTAAHIAVAFDTFESRVVAAEADPPARQVRPLYAYGLLSFFERDFIPHPAPLWRSSVPPAAQGDKHPSDRTHTDRLTRIQQAIERSVARSITTGTQIPTLQTEISPEKALSLRQLHQRCDWVITLDRNGGVEYFDSPRDNKDIYDVYVIDTVPEREDLGCLQLITSTSNLAEIRNLLDGALDQMGLSHSRRNAEFLMDHLKALSGRLAIRLTGQNAPTSELIALALCHANCFQAQKGAECWTPLDTGFLIPVDDVQDLIRPLSGWEPAAAEDDAMSGNARPDLIYVSVVPRKGLSFQFIEVKYRRHLRTSRSPEMLEHMQRQVNSLHKRWDEWYANEGDPRSFTAVRRAKLARVLRFYVDKAHRHYLPVERYQELVAEIDRMVERGNEYSFAPVDKKDFGWVFCPEYAGAAPLCISPASWDTKIFLFGPGMLPDLAFGPEPRDTPVVVTGNGGVVTGALPVVETEPRERPFTGVEQADDGLSPAATGQVQLPRDGRDADMPEVGQASLEGVELETAVTHDPTICLGTDVLTGSEIQWPLTIKGNPHLLLAGLPGMGKTTCLVNLCRQMLAADVRPIVFSYHEDIDEQLEGLGMGVRFLDFRGLGFNPLQVINRESPLAYLDMAGSMRDIFVAIYPELGDIQGERIRKAIKDSFIELGWDDPNADQATLVEPSFGRFVEILRADPKPDKGLSMLLLRLDELDDYGLFRLDKLTASLWESDKPVVIRIHKTQNDNLQKAFASLVLYGLYKDMFRRGVQSRITHAVIFDEAHRAAKLHLIPTMAKECRKYGISLVLASQEARDFNVSLFSAIANYLVLRLNETDAKALTRNVASSDQERMLVDKIKQMDRFRALYFCEGKKKPSLVSLLP